MVLDRHAERIAKLSDRRGRGCFQRRVTERLGGSFMSDLKDPHVIWIKGMLFLLLGLCAAVLLVLQAPTITVVILLCLCVWAFCRFYYFAFYVIEHYVDSTYRYSGLLSFLHYALAGNRRDGSQSDEQRDEARRVRPDFNDPSPPNSG